MRTRIQILLSLLVLQFGLQAASPNKLMRSGWFEWEPYNYAQSRRGHREMTGMDVELARASLQRMGYRLDLVELSWEQQIRGLTNGTLDVAFGAVPEDAPRGSVYISAPYREEKIRLHVRHGTLPLSETDTLATLADKLLKAKLNVGVGQAYSYGRQLDAWLKQFDDAGAIIRKVNEHELIDALQEGEIDAIVADELVIATLSTDPRLTPRLDTHPLLLAHNDVHVLFSRKTCTPEQVARFNSSMQSLRNDGEYRKIVRDYFFPLVLRQAAEQPWFYWIEMIGVIAAGTSGLLLARQASYTLSGTVILVFLAALGGGYARDMISERSPNLIISSPTRVWILLGIAIGGSLLLRACARLEFFQRERSRLVMAIVTHCSDSLGMAAFTVFGVVVAIQTKCEPIYLWGPLFSVMTSLGGGLARDVVANSQIKGLLQRSYYAHFLFAWGLLFALFLHWESAHLQTHAVVAAFIATMAGVFITTFAMKLRDMRLAVGR